MLLAKVWKDEDYKSTEHSGSCREVSKASRYLATVLEDNHPPRQFTRCQRPECFV